MRTNRGPWYLFTGLVIGLAMGLIYAWAMEPVRYVDAAPGALEARSRDQYRAMIALAYQADANLGRARQRLALLNDSNPAQALATQAQSAADLKTGEASALAALAAAYNPQPTVIATATQVTASTQVLPSRAPTGELSPTATLEPGQAVRTPTPRPSTAPTISPTATRLLTLTARATLRPSPTLGAPFSLKDKQKVCNPAQPAILQVEVFDSAGKPVPGLAIHVTWPPNNQDVFYTGLKLEVSPGYADFQMAGDITYAVQVGDNGETVSGINSQDCARPEGSGTFLGSWKLRFVQP